LRVKTSGITDVGLKREGNEDSFSVEDDLGLYVVADGMGGHQAGEIASSVALDMINKSIRKWMEGEAREDDLYGPPDDSLTTKGNYILSGIRLANKVVFEMATANEKYHGMGTTVVLLLVLPTRVIAANVGDSRLYLIRDGRVERLSKDHTIVSEQVEMGLMTKEDAATSPLKHILTRNLGSNENVAPDIFEIEPSNNDRFVLCSDGLTDLMTDEEILEMTEKDNDPDSLCRKFIEVALKRGAPDNTTVIAVFLSGISKRKRSPFKKIGVLLAGSLKGKKKKNKR